VLKLEIVHQFQGKQLVRKLWFDIKGSQPNLSFPTNVFDSTLALGKDQIKPLFFREEGREGGRGGTAALTPSGVH
jgi:hypothetical protein